jgi:hypothetical protein
MNWNQRHNRQSRHAGRQSWPKIARPANAKAKKPHKKTPPPEGSGVVLIMTCKEEFFVLGRPGSDLLSQGLSHSTIGAEEFNGRVRDGIGFKLLARTTRPAKDKETKQAVWSMRMMRDGH